MPGPVRAIPVSSLPSETGTGLLLDSHHRICRSSLQRLESRQEFTLELEQAGV
jgi:hypothetical protein